MKGSSFSSWRWVGVSCELSRSRQLFRISTKTPAGDDGSDVTRHAAMMTHAVNGMAVQAWWNVVKAVLKRSLQKLFFSPQGPNTVGTV